LFHCCLFFQLSMVCHIATISGQQHQYLFYQIEQAVENMKTSLQVKCSKLETNLVPTWHI
jgi:hypothetical protein